MTELRLRSQISAESMAGKVGKILTEADRDVVLTGPATVRQPDGQLLCVYLPGAVKAVGDATYPLLTKVRGTSYNRHNAAGAKSNSRVGPAGTMHVTRGVTSILLGAVDPAVPRFPHCRLTSFTAREVDAWEGMQPLWRAIATLFEQHVPDRYAVQAREAAKTQTDWVIKGTPFTTITVNNSYSTGVHKDKGDLDAGFSCLAVLRRGEFIGGDLVFPEYRVAVAMRDGDLLLMNAHAWHGNTEMWCACGDLILERPCKVCKAERISVVCYFRTKMIACRSPQEEYAKRITQKEIKA